MAELPKDFTRPSFSHPVDAMWEFFHENPHFKCVNFEPIHNGVRAFYVITH